MPAMVLDERHLRVSSSGECVRCGEWDGSLRVLLAESLRVAESASLRAAEAESLRVAGEGECVTEWGEW